ncbi:hypothetical protein QQF64_009759 [Cirrhinus molitorella]|uniref:Uncharacterized protein n=1 Tax=Cirrhinus molitorella TaxID=172907 RepID=A0ABR3M5M8_9TELE
MKELGVERMFPLSLVCVKFTSHVSSSLLYVREGEIGEERKGEDRMLVARGVERLGGLRQQMGCPAVCLIETQNLEPTHNNITSSCQLQPGNKSAFPRLCCREHDSARRKKRGPAKGTKGPYFLGLPGCQCLQGLCLCTRR